VVPTRHPVLGAAGSQIRWHVPAPAIAAGRHTSPTMQSRESAQGSSMASAFVEQSQTL
jgi:hypothetical protein